MAASFLRDRLRYRFDEFMARGTGALLGGLFLASAVLIFSVAAVVAIFGQAPAVESGDRPGFLGLAWMSLLRTLDSGTMGGDQGSVFFLASMLVVTLGGVFIVSTLIGVLNNGLEERLAQLRKGRSRVVETGHTVILGWSSNIFTLISELVEASANQRRSCIVVLADRDKVEMEDAVREHVGDTRRTKVVCRTGSPIEVADLAIAGIDAAKSIVVLSSGDDADTGVIKTLLAITNNPGRRSEPYHIVAEIRESRNLDVARMVGKDEAELILVGDLISRVIAQTCRQSGLSVVYTELLDFGGDEIYFTKEPALVGKTFGHSLSAYEDSAVMGIKRAGEAPKLNPPMDTVLQQGDALIVIAEDDDTIRLSGRPADAPATGAIVSKPPSAPSPEATLILGWNWRAPTIVAELDQYVASGSTVTVVADVRDGAAILERECHTTNQAVTFQDADTTDRRVLDALDVGRYDHIILLCYSDSMTAQQADARTLITLLHLRDIAARTGSAVSVVSEMLDLRNRALAEVTKADDFIVSDRLVSLMLAQVAENKHLNAVFQDLFDPDGSEIYLKPAGDYVQTGVPVSFYTVIEAAKRRGEVAIGYRRKAASSDATQAYGVAVNPKKSATVSFEAADRIVVLADS